MATDGARFGGDVQADDADDCADEDDPAGAVREVAADVRAGGREGDSEGDEAHRLAEDRTRVDTLATEGQLLGIGLLERHHTSTT